MPDGPGASCEKEKAQIRGPKVRRGEAPTFSFRGQN